VSMYFKHNYLPAVLRYAQRVHLSAGGCESGGEHLIQVLHDDWCAFFQGRACNCDPIVRPLPGPPKATP